jgi:group I intron endonuclease
MTTWTIYCHTHIDSDRVYVGLTSQTTEKRWKTHVSHAKNSKGGRWHFPNAIRKYGKDAFSHRVLEVCDSLEKANLREEAWIELFESRDLRFGFNIAKGGASFSSDLRNTKEKLSEITKNNITPERRRHLSLLRKGKPLSAETKAKISASAKANSKQIAESNRRRDPAIMQKFIRAGLLTNTPEKYKKISVSLRGKPIDDVRKSILKENYANLSLESRQKISESFRGKNHSAETKRKISESTKLQKRNSAGQYSSND